MDTNGYKCTRTAGIIRSGEPRTEVRGCMARLKISHASAQADAVPRTFLSPRMNTDFHGCRYVFCSSGFPARDLCCCGCAAGAFFQAVCLTRSREGKQTRSVSGGRAGELQTEARGCEPCVVLPARLCGGCTSVSGVCGCECSFGGRRFRLPPAMISTETGRGLRQPHGDNRALPRLAGQRNLAMVSPDDALSNRQAQPGTAAAARPVGSEEPIEHAWKMFG